MSEAPEGFVPVAPDTMAKDGLSIVIRDPKGQHYMGPRVSIGLDPIAPPISQQPFPIADKTKPSNEPLIDLGKIVRQGALPTIGGAVGSAIGTIVAPGPGSLAGLSLGSMAGEGLNQLTGITEPSKLSMGLSGALPFLPAAFRTVVSNTPGAEAGLQQLAVKAARQIPKSVAPTESPAALYEAAKGAGAAVPKGPMGAAMANVAEKEAMIAPELRSAAVKKVIGATQRLLDFGSKELMPGRPGTPDVPLEILLPNLQRLGAIYRTAAKKGGSALAEIAEMYGGLQESLDVAAQRGTGPGVEILRRANDQFKRQLAEGELHAMVRKAINFTAGHRSFNADLVLKRLDEGAEEMKRLSKWLPKEDLASIRETLTTLAKVPSVTAAGKGSLSGLGFAQRAVVGGTMGAALGGPPGAAAGVIATEALTRAMMTPAGRNLVKGMASPSIGGHGATFDTIMNTLLQGARPTPPGMARAEEPEVDEGRPLPIHPMRLMK